MKRFNHLFGILGLSIGSLLPAQAQDPLTNGLVAYYPFSGSANDETGNGNGGAVIGYDWWFGGDRFGQPDSLYLNTTSPPAGDLDGAYVVAARPASLDFNQDFTLSVWVTVPNRLSAYYAHNLVSNGVDTNSANFRLTTDSNPSGQDFLQFVCNHTLGDINAFLPTIRDTWWQAAAVRSGNTVSLFRNGRLVASSLVATTVVNSPVIWIGKYDCGATTTCPGSYSLIGGIDDVRIYDRALSPKEVRQLYEHEANPLPFLTIAVKTVRLDLFVAVGTTNQLFSSTDLSSWAPYGPPFTATNSIIYQDVEVGDGQQYFKVRLVP